MEEQAKCVITRPPYTVRPRPKQFTRPPPSPPPPPLRNSGKVCVCEPAQCSPASAGPHTSRFPNIHFGPAFDAQTNGFKIQEHCLEAFLFFGLVFQANTCEKRTLTCDVLERTRHETGGEMRDGPWAHINCWADVLMDGVNNSTNFAHTLFFFRQNNRICKLSPVGLLQAAL